MNERELIIAKWHVKRDINTQKIKALWSELKDVQRNYSDCGAEDSDVDWKVQSMLYAMSFDVPVDVPKTPKRYQLLVTGGTAERTFECAKEFHRILKLIKAEFHPFGSGLLPAELDEWLFVSCWRFCKRT
jgi:hypothetical protein